jgi:glycosyltransferase involved in cell wall biosynthesis
MGNSHHDFMKVAFVVHDFDANYGQGRYGVELAKRLANRCDFTVYANTFNAPGLKNVRWQPVAACRSNVVTTVLSFLPAAEWLVRRDKPDIIHAQGLTCWSADVITGHICNAARARSLATHRRRSKWFIQLMSPIERLFYRQRRASHLIGISQSLANEIRRDYGWNKGVSIIHHGTNTDQFHPPSSPAEKAALKSQFHLPPGFWHWLFMGEAVKGLRQAIESLQHFSSAFLLVVSRSDTTTYKNLARKLGVMDRIRFWGYESRPELAFQAVDLFLYPSDYDPFGMVGAEAMASGLPVIVGSSTGVAELITHGVDGLLCDAADQESILSQIHVLQKEPSLATRIGINARKTILTTSWDKNADEVFRIFESVVSQRTNAR